MKQARIPPDIFFLDRQSKRSLQSQIRETVIAAILSLQAPPGTILPSSRRLADHLGVARMTVTLAFQELIAQGYVEGQSRAGYRVADSDTAHRIAADDGEAPRDNSRFWDRFLPDSLATRRRIQKPLDWRSLPYSFVYGQMDTTLFNHTAWRNCARQALGTRDFDAMAGDLVAADDPLLVNYIRARTLPRRGITADPDQILVTVGAQNALWLIIALLTRRQINAVCENPGYPDTVAALRWHGADVTPVDIDADGLPPDRIPPGTDAVFVTPSHHAPTSTTMPKARRLQLLADAEAQDFIVVEDDYEFEMSYLEPPSPALKSFDRNDRVIYVGSFSKSLFPGLRLGYLVAPPRIIAEARELRSLMLRHPAGHQQRTAAYFMAQGHFDIQIRNMRRQFARRREAMQTALEDTGFHVAGAASFGGSSLWVRGPDGLDSTRLAQSLLEDGVLIEPGAPFFDGDRHPTEYFRLGFSSIPVDRIKTGISLIATHARRLCI
ncbi:MAG: PLP-dependent aminotransferase family protein [Albidovulum sp.]|uniref:MocR-like pyridoxine biosynthesis transcription factor PdxR n=1 Tax=Albidovulum sp. TaxID=1872424 RepID=UPI003C8BBCBF